MQPKCIGRGCWATNWMCVTNWRLWCNASKSPFAKLWNQFRLFIGLISFSHLKSKTVDFSSRTKVGKEIMYHYSLDNDFILVPIRERVRIGQEWYFLIHSTWVICWFTIKCLILYLLTLAYLLEVWTWRPRHCFALEAFWHPLLGHYCSYRRRQAQINWRNDYEDGFSQLPWIIHFWSRVQIRNNKSWTTSAHDIL